jgi:hypothetical protein
MVRSMAAQLTNAPGPYKSLPGVPVTSRRDVMMPVKINVKHFSQLATGSKPVLGH